MDITNTLIQEIVAHCQKRGFVVPPQLAGFFTKTLLMQEEKDETGAVELSPRHIENIVDQAVGRLTQSDSPALETLKMQAAIVSQQQDTVNANRTEAVHHRAKSQQLLAEVCEKVDHNKVFGDIVLYILHETGLFTSNNELVHKETMTALESVIPRGSIESFISQNDSEKIKQLDELRKIVWGIRLFNRETHKGGAGIHDVPGELATMVQQTQGTLNQEQEQIARLADNYMVVLMTPEVKNQMDGAARQRLNDEYVNRRQYVHYVKKLSTIVSDCARRLGTTRPAYDDLVADVKAQVTNSNSVPKSQIYPKFIDISENWDTFKKLHKTMQETKKVLDLLLAYQHSFTQTLKPAAVEDAQKIQDSREKAPPSQVLLEQDVNNAIYPHRSFYAPQLPATERVAFAGFCPVSLVEGSVLKPGDPGVGYLRYNDTFYAFADEKALRSFLPRPQQFVTNVVNPTDTSNTALIHLLELESDLPTELYLEGTRQKQAAVVEVQKIDADTQTGHIDPYKDYKYEWNEWELRRLALKLAALRNKRTHSCQTKLSHFKRDNDTQTYPKTQTSTQTLLDKSTQPRKTTQYITGLRGDPDSQVKVVKMTFED